MKIEFEIPEMVSVLSGYALDVILILTAFLMLSALCCAIYHVFSKRNIFITRIKQKKENNKPKDDNVLEFKRKAS